MAIPENIATAFNAVIAARSNLEWTRSSKSGLHIREGREVAGRDSAGELYMQHHFAKAMVGAHYWIRAVMRDRNELKAIAFNPGTMHLHYRVTLAKAKFTATGRVQGKKDTAKHGYFATLEDALAFFDKL